MPLLTKYIDMLYKAFFYPDDDETVNANIVNSINNLLDKYGEEVVMQTVTDNMTPSLKRKLRKLDQKGAWNSHIFWDLPNRISDNAMNFLIDLGDEVWSNKR
jgi:hypothetical protein